MILNGESGIISHDSFIDIFCFRYVHKIHDCSNPHRIETFDIDQCKPFILKFMVKICFDVQSNTIVNMYLPAMIKR